MIVRTVNRHSAITITFGSHFCVFVKIPPQNGDFVRGVVSKRPITGRISKRGFENGDLATSIRRALSARSVLRVLTSPMEDVDIVNEEDNE